nr:hypothetical protein [Tanacetum cinerariifolium]
MVVAKRPNLNDKQEVKRADDQEIKNVKDEDGTNVQDQQVFEADDDTNNDDFDCSLPPHKGVNLTVKEVVFENTTSDLKKDKDEYSGAMAQAITPKSAATSAKVLWHQNCYDTTFSLLLRKISMRHLLLKLELLKEKLRQLVDILRNLEQIYPPAFFDIIIHLVIHLPQEALKGRPIHYRWMYLFEIYMKKLKNYVRNKSKPKGSISEGYVAEKALIFCSRYFRDVTMNFNLPDRNVDCPSLTCQCSSVRSICRSIGKRSVIRLDYHELKKVIWYVLHNSREIDTYLDKFKSEFPNHDMKEEFPG